MGTILGREPALILAAISAAINVALVLHLVVLTGDQVATLNIFTAAIVGLIVRQAVTPVASPVLPVGTAVKTPAGLPATVNSA